MPEKFNIFDDSPPGGQASFGPDALPGGGTALPAQAFDPADVPALILGAAVPTEGAGLLGLGISPVGIAIGVASIALSHFLNKKPKETALKGFAFRGLSSAPADPTAKRVIIFGNPVWEPPIKTRYVSGLGSLNTTAPSLAEELTMLLHGGVGRQDGGNLRLWTDDEPMFDVVDEDSPIAERTLAAKDGARKVFLFPKDNVQSGSIALYLDGVRTGLEAGADLPDDVETELINHSFKSLPAVAVPDPEKFGGRTNPTFFKHGVIGFHVPHNKVKLLNFEVQANIHKTDSFGTTKASGNPWPFRFREKLRTVTLEEGDYILSTGKEYPLAFNTDRRRHVRVLQSFLDKNVQPARENQVGLQRGEAIKDFVVSYDIVVTPETGVAIPTFELGKNSQNRSTVTFAKKVGAAVVVTATYKTTPLGDSFEHIYRDGSLDQDPVPGTGVKHTVPLFQTLGQGILRTHSTEHEVDDVVVSIQSDGNFLATAISGKNAGEQQTVFATIRIRLKTTSAPSAPTSTKDPQNGWVEVVNRTLFGQVKGTASWPWSMADQLAKLKGESTEKTSLPRAAYDVEVVRLDAFTDNSRFEDKILLGHVTEVIAERFVLPGEALHRVRFTDVDEITSEPRIRLQARGLMVKNHTTGKTVWSRNPVWCALHLFLDELNGGGRYYTLAANVDLQSAKDAAAWCDELESNGDGTSEVRAEVDIALDTAKNLYVQISDVLAGARVLPVMTGGVLTFKIDRDDAPVVLPGGGITDADVFLRSDGMADLSHEEIPTHYQIAYTNEEVDHKPDLLVVAEDVEDAPEQVFRTIDMTGVRRRSQVLRIAPILLSQARLQTERIDFVAAGWRLIQLVAGDIVPATLTTHDEVAGLFRVIMRGFDSKLRVVLSLVRHEPRAYSGGFKGAVSSVIPGLRDPTEPVSPIKPKGTTNTSPVTVTRTLFVRQLVVETVLGTGNNQSRKRTEPAKIA